MWRIRSQVAESNLASPKPTVNAMIVLIVFGRSPMPTGFPSMNVNQKSLLPG